VEGWRRIRGRERDEGDGAGYIQVRGGGAGTWAGSREERNRGGGVFFEMRETKLGATDGHGCQPSSCELGSIKISGPGQLTRDASRAPASVGQISRIKVTRVEQTRRSSAHCLPRRKISVTRCD
jgi:hypothetical protein